jgi:CheY-like chemotaxis protein
MLNDVCMPYFGFWRGAFLGKAPLLACPMSAEPPVQAAAVKPCPKPRTGSSILLVDDDAFILEAVGGILSLLGFSPVFAATGEEALAKLEEGLEPALVILDMDMPGLGGAGTLPLLRGRRPELPVMISTGRVDAKVAELLQRHSHVTLLPKPFGVRELKARLL